MRDKNKKELTEAIQRVLSGDVNAYRIIYDIIDRPLRSYIGILYGRHEYEIQDEIANRTHEFIFENLSRYDPARASFQRWANLASRNVALRVMTERFNLRKVETGDGRWERFATTIAMDEEALALVARSVPGTEEIHDAEWQEHLLWKEYDELASEGRLSMAFYDLGDKNLADTASELGMPVIRLRRLLDKNHNRLRKRLKRKGVRPVESEPHYGRVWHDPDDTGYDDDWISTQTAELPVKPDSRSGAAAEEIEIAQEEEVVPD